MTDSGRLTVIAGPMFSGKSEELMRRVRRATIAGVDVLVVSHSLDTRSDISTITSHTGVNIPAVPLGDSAFLAEAARQKDYDLIAIDEAQFFGAELIPAVDELLRQGFDVIVEGLCVTFDGQPFEPLPSFMAVAEEVLRLTAVCTVCGKDAVFHQRLEQKDSPIGSGPAKNAEAPQETLAATAIDASHIGGLDSYVARCRQHFTGADRGA
ncbi:thymidine kinase [Brevibacterium siliguriense]|uniref:Thymidine kinase n=1 Tax=Brevibacterium siliguriense TaxID=1136497 RepID=A0A1H1VMJ5_9MICO|nr:thymidine kinase [Brevibacterium siliguriense]SDS85269.1 thymidine kinase [Brevibacterium siliguriense]